MKAQQKKQASHALKMPMGLTATLLAFSAVGVFSLVSCGPSANKETAITDCQAAPAPIGPATVTTTTSLTGPEENAVAAAYLAEATATPASEFQTSDGKLPADTTFTTDSNVRFPTSTMSPSNTATLDPNNATFSRTTAGPDLSGSTKDTKPAEAARRAEVKDQRDAQKESQDSMTPCTPQAFASQPPLTANQSTGQASRGDKVAKEGGGSPTANPIGDIDQFGNALEAKASKSPTTRQTDANAILTALPSSTPIPQTSSMSNACESSNGLSDGSGSQIKSENGNCEQRRGNQLGLTGGEK